VVAPNRPATNMATKHKTVPHPAAIPPQSFMKTA